MMIRRQCAVISLTVLLLFVLTANLYFIYMIVEDKTPNIVHKEEIKMSSSKENTLRQSSKDKHHVKSSSTKHTTHGLHRNATEFAKKRILLQLAMLPEHLISVNEDYSDVLNNVMRDLEPTKKLSAKQVWLHADKWVTPREIVPEKASLLGSILQSLCSSKILKAQSAKQFGTQLKLLLTLEGNQRAIFKPRWYSRDQVIEGPVYAGKDRHNAEVAAFHLGILLGLRRSPLVVGRRVSLRREVMPVADRELLDTFYQEGNNTCMYGVCHYCGPHDPVCAHRDLLEGALVLWLPPRYRLKKLRHPWQRTYREAMPSRWEAEQRYCDRVKAARAYKGDSGKERLLDLVDASILDFLIDNGDRHHFEMFENVSKAAVLLLDNGKSFGNPGMDHIDILAPLYQCCVLRRSTWDRLILFSGGSLSSALEQTLFHSHISPVLNSEHLSALDRRLRFVFAAVYACVAEAKPPDLDTILTIVIVCSYEANGKCSMAILCLGSIVNIDKNSHVMENSHQDESCDNDHFYKITGATNRTFLYWPPFN